MPPMKKWHENGVHTTRERRRVGIILHALLEITVDTCFCCSPNETTFK